MSRDLNSYASAFAVCQSEVWSFRNKLIDLRAALMKQVEEIDRYLAQGDWDSRMQSPPRQAGFWTDEWAAISRKEADNAGGTGSTAG